MNTYEAHIMHHTLRSCRVKVPPLFSTLSPLYLFTFWSLEPSQADATGFTSDCLLLLCCVVGAPQHPDSLHWHRAESWVITLLLNFRQVVTHHQLEEEHQNAIKYRTVTDRPLIKMWSCVTVHLNMTERYQDVTDMHFFFQMCFLWKRGPLVIQIISK